MKSRSPKQFYALFIFMKMIFLTKKNLTIIKYYIISICSACHVSRSYILNWQNLVRKVIFSSLENHLYCLYANNNSDKNRYEWYNVSYQRIVPLSITDNNIYNCSVYTLYGSHSARGQRRFENCHRYNDDWFRIFGPKYYCGDYRKSSCGQSESIARRRWQWFFAEINRQHRNTIKGHQNREYSCRHYRYGTLARP